MSHNHPRRALPALAVTALLAGLVIAAPVSGATGAFTNPTPITIDSQDGYAGGNNPTDIVLGDVAGQGSSSIDLVAPAGAAINDVRAVVYMNHERLDDVDLMLVSPAGKGVMLLSDAGGTNSFNSFFYFYPWGSEAFDESSPYNYISPTDWDTTTGDSDAFPAPAPAAPGSNFDSLYGSSVNGTWTLYAVDDTDGSVGTITDWYLDVYYSQAAAPSPSTVSVAGLPNSVTDVDLSLNDIDMEYLGNTEFVLESPDGRRAHVLSDAGGWNTLTDVTLTLDDEALEPLMRNRTAKTGTYQPVNYDDGDTSEFVGGFDTRNLSSSLSTFDGANPNGDWKLYVNQEYCFCSEALNAISGGWSLKITTADATATPVITSPANGSSDDDGSVTVTGTAAAGALVKVTTGGMTRNTVADGGAWTVTFGDLADGSHTFTATATNASGNVSAPASVTVKVDAVVADTTAPKVRTVKPRKDEMRIDVSASAMVRFSEAMNASSVKRAVKLVSMESGKAVAVKLSYKASKNRVTINPKQDLDRNTTYMVVVKKSAKDLAGNALLKTRKSIFNTL